MRKDRFTDEALAQAKALAELKYSENPEDQLAFSEAYDFARCQRPDGSFYPIPDGKQCRKGKKAAAAESGPPKPRRGSKVRRGQVNPQRPSDAAREEKNRKRYIKDLLSKIERNQAGYRKKEKEERPKKIDELLERIRKMREKGMSRNQLKALRRELQRLQRMNIDEKIAARTNRNVDEVRGARLKKEGWGRPR